MYSEFLKLLREKLESLECKALIPGRIEANIFDRTIIQNIEIVGCGGAIRIEYSTTNKTYRVTDSVLKEIKEFISNDIQETVDYIMSILGDIENNFLRELKLLVEDGEF